MLGAPCSLEDLLRTTRQQTEGRGRLRLAAVVGGSPLEGLKRIADGVVRLCARGIEQGLSEDDEFWCQDELGTWG